MIYRDLLKSIIKTLYRAYHHRVHKSLLRYSVILILKYYIKYSVHMEYFFTFTLSAADFRILRNIID